MMRNLRLIGLVCGALLVLVACGDQVADEAPDEGAGAPATDEEATGEEATGEDAAAAGDCTLDEPVRIGVVFSQTGGAAVYGATQVAGVELAAEQLNGRGAGVTYELVIEDDASDPAQGITAYEKLINQDQVSAIIGPTLSNTMQSTGPVAQDAGVPAMGVSTTAEGITDIGEYVFRDSLTEGDVIPQTVAAANEAFGLEQVAVMYGDDDAFTVSGWEIFVQALEDEGIETTTTQTFAKGDTDFSAQLTEVRNTDPDALVVSGLAEENALILTQARDLGIDVPVLGGNGFNSPAIAEQAGDAAEGVLVGAAWNSASDAPMSQDFIAAYEEANGSPPDQFAAQAYTGMMLYAQAIESACSADRDDIREALNGLDNVPTVLGDFSFDDNRDAVHEAVVQIIENGQFAVFQG